MKPFIEYDLPVNYNKLNWKERRDVRNQYVKKQEGLCMYCGCRLDEDPAPRVKEKKIFWELFPSNFLKYPIHLQHNHVTGMTEGAVHALCNAVMWQYEGR